MWMGGNVPLGYGVRERKLVVSEAEASTVRMIFRRYAELGSVALLKAELERAGIVSKRREGADGELSGGKRFSRGALYLMLQNWLSRGNVPSLPAAPVRGCRKYIAGLKMPKRFKITGRSWGRKVATHGLSPPTVLRRLSLLKK
ncbi:MAG TPA: hypothetical protein VGZ47_09335 [Gemmataceae bacterium]|jgi:hypothetical protein|nr:hypothetical protein [Gemmataceae bacterium]